MPESIKDHEVPARIDLAREAPLSQEDLQPLSTKRRRNHVSALRRRSDLSVSISVLSRVALALALIGIALGGHWIDRGGVRDNVDNVVSFVDVLYVTMITVTTVGYGDIVPVTEQARLFDTLRFGRCSPPERVLDW